MSADRLSIACRSARNFAIFNAGTCGPACRSLGDPLSIAVGPAAGDSGRRPATTRSSDPLDVDAPLPQRPRTCTQQRREMEVLARVQAGGRAIECGLAITTQERAAVLAQRFRVYRRRGYYRPGLRADRDDYDKNAVYFLAMLPDSKLGNLLLVRKRSADLRRTARGLQVPRREGLRVRVAAGG